MVTKNTWIKGLNQDISKLKYSPENYLYGNNIRILTEDGGTSFAIQNRKGTIFNSSLPSVISATFKLDYRGLTGNQNLVLTSGQTLTINDVETKTNEQITDEINTWFISLGIDDRAYYNNEYIVIYDTSINIPSSPGSSKRTDDFVPFIIGWGHYLNYIVLALCDNSKSDANLNTNYIGAFMIFKINDSTNQINYLDGSTLTLGGTIDQVKAIKYIGLLNFSKKYEIYKHLIFRYESETTLRCIYTDALNSLGIINLLDPQVYATPEEQIEYLPGHKPQEPQLRIIEGGFLPVAKYYYFYQLQSLSGATSSISPLSNGIVITKGNLNDFNEYNAFVPGTSSNKSVEITVPNVDTTYDIIRFGYCVYQINNVPEVFWFDEKFIENVIDIEGSITTVHNGNENEIPLDDITEISNVNRPPETFETISVVRNRLSAANASTNIFDVTFDSRTYRFEAPVGVVSNSYNYNASNNVWGSPSVIIKYNSSTGLFNYNQGGPSVIGDKSILTGLNADWDLINPYNNEDDNNFFNNTNWLLNSQFKFNPITGNYGGIGPNLSYEFIIEENLADIGTSNLNHITPSTSVSNPPYINTNQSNTYSYNYNGSFDTPKSPYIESLFKGFARGEVYRMGIVFLDKKGYPTPVKWIGDIKFPYFNDSDSGEDYSMSRIDSLKVITKQLGIKFTLDTTTTQFQAIKDQISGWYYVRVQRNEFDKTKLGTGKINSIYLTTGNRYLEALSGLAGGILLNQTVQNNILSFDFPNDHFNIHNNYINGDYLRVITDEIIPLSATQILSNNLLSKYRINNSDYTYGSKIDIQYRWRVDRSYSQDLLPADPSNQLPFPYYNMADSNGTDADANEFLQAGSLTSLITLPSGATYTLPTSSTKNSFFASYERYLNVQYGGNTYADRFGQEYIPCQFQPYNPIINNGNIETNVFNGDTLVVYYDHQKLEQNFDELSGYDSSDPTPNDADRYAIFYIAECHNFNSELRILSGGYTFHAANRGFGSNANTILRNEFLNNCNLAYVNENNHSIYLTPLFNQSLITKEPNTIYITDPKIDNERIDSWRKFRINNSLTVNGNFGPIKRLITLKDKLYFYQENAFGIAAVDERVIIDENDTSQTQLGTGTPLQRYDYISTETGLSHKWAVTPTGSTIHHYDANLSKWFVFNEGSTQPLSDIKGLSGYFRNLNSNIKIIDEIILLGSLHMEYDPIYNVVYLTNNIDPKQTSNIDTRFTLSYNGFLDAFESFHDFIPFFYLSSKRKLYSLTQSLNGSFANIYIHDLGEYNRIYSNLFPCKVKFRINENSDITKIFDNFVFNTEVYDNSGINLAKTIDKIQVTNDYQDTGLINLVAGSNIKQRVRSWRTTVPLDNTNPLLRLKPRMNDKYIDVELTYTGLEGEQFILHDVLTEYSTRGQIIPK